MSAMASQITSLTIVHSSVYSGADQRKHQSSSSLAFVRGIHRWPVNSPHKGPVTRKMFPYDDILMTMPPRGRHGVPNLQRFGSLFDSLFRLTTNKTRKLHIPGTPHNWRVIRKAFPYHDVFTFVHGIRKKQYLEPHWHNEGKRDRHSACCTSDLRWMGGAAVMKHWQICFSCLLMSSFMIGIFVRTKYVCQSTVSFSHAALPICLDNNIIIIFSAHSLQPNE